MSKTKTEWRDCADPDELAAAVAAGVEVLAMARAGDFPTANQTADQFAGSLRAGITYQLPHPGGDPVTAPEWRECDDPWRPEPPADDLRERRVWTCKIGGRVGRLPSGADWPMRKAVVAAFTELTGQPVEFCFSGWGDDLDESELAVVEDRAPDPEVIRAALAKRLEALPNPEPPALAVLPTPPAPPWPGAVLSGLVDEDGEPTWLAQAGQVRGEQVRGWRDMAWYTGEDGHSSDTWVEVRAPRAMPEPETERVPVWEAVDRWMPGGRVICGWQWSTQTRDGSVTHDDGTFTPVHDAPTVEVLKDGGR